MTSYADLVGDARWAWKSAAQNPDMRAVFATAYPKIAPAILGVAYREGVAFPQALFLIAQAFVEQSRTVGNPAASGYRIFNMQLHNDELATLSAADQAAMSTRPVPVPGRPGVSVKRIASWEVIGGHRVLRNSPFFAFSSMERSVNHFLRRLAGDTCYFLTLGTAEMLAVSSGYARAFAVLKRPSSGVDDYTKALQAAGYSTAGSAYVTEIHGRYRTVLNDFAAMADANRPAFATSFLEWAPGQDEPGRILDDMKAQAKAALTATPALAVTR